MLALILASLLACKDKSTDDTAATDDSGSADDSGQAATPGKLALRFAMDDAYIEVMDEDPVGAFYGALWRDEDVDGGGPADGAEDLGSVYVEEVDLRPDGSPTDVLFTTGDLTGKVVVLGFLDSDANADPDNADPDNHDPVTLPGDNEFEVIGGETTEVDVYFAFLYP